MTLLLQKKEAYGNFDKAPGGMDAGLRAFEGLDLRGLGVTPSGGAFITSANEAPHEAQGDLEQSSYEMAQDQSHLAANVDAWLTSTSADMGVQNGVPTVQRSTLTPQQGSCFDMARVWCLLALAIPLLGQPQWTFRCTPSGLINSAELMLVNMSWMMERARAQLQRLARAEVTRETCAAILDVLLVIYALGFMLISMYQAMVIG